MRTFFLVVVVVVVVVVEGCSPPCPQANVPTIDGSDNGDNDVDFPVLTYSVDTYAADRVVIDEVESGVVLSARGLAAVPDDVTLAEPAPPLDVVEWRGDGAFETANRVLNAALTVRDDVGALFAFVSVGGTAFDIDVADIDGRRCRFDDRVDASVAAIGVAGDDGDVLVNVGESAVVTVDGVRFLAQATEAFFVDELVEGAAVERPAGQVLIRRVE